jgi:hypothetical protein
MGNITRKKGVVERRQHKRFQVHDGAFAVLRPRSDILGQVIDIVGQIVDISQGGLMFRYITSENLSHEPFELDIVLAGDDFRLHKIPFKAVSDMDMADALSFSPATMRRQGVQFGALTHDQKAQLEYFIRNHTTGTVRLNCSAHIKEQGQSLPCR